MTKHLMGAAMALALFSTPSFAAGAKQYQVTGEVTDVSNDQITVTKGKEKFELNRDADTKAPAELKKGDRVTVMYTMTAKSVEAKTAGKSAEKKAHGKTEKKTTTTTTTESTGK